MTNEHPIDDFNQKIIWYGSLIGTITTMFSRDSVRHGWKLLVEYD